MLRLCLTQLTIRWHADATYHFLHVSHSVPARMISVWICLQSLLGMNHIHGKKIIHRDIKALNLFIDYKDNIKVRGFLRPPALHAHLQVVGRTDICMHHDACRLVILVLLEL